MIAFRRLWFIVVVVGIVTAASAQTTRPAFDVASVKRAGTSLGGGRVQFLPGGRFVAENAPLEFVLQQVYDVRPFQVVVDPKWKDIAVNARYRIEATASASASGELQKEMAKTLLAERFGLKLHMDRREFPVYVLATSRRGVKGARPANGRGGGVAVIVRGWLRGQGVAPERLAQVLSTFVDRPVIDRTKLDQVLDFDLTFTPPDAAGAAASNGPGCPPNFREMAERLKVPTTQNCPSIFSAVDEQLGLTLTPQNALLEVLVIDSVHAPTEN